MSKSKPVTLGEVARAVGGRLSGDAEAKVFEVTHDSRQVGAGWLFVAISGANVDAHRFVTEVASKGAAGVVSERERPADFAGAWVQVGDARRALAFAADAVHGHPSREQRLVGIAGTNGKTTTAFLVASLAEGSGERVALLSAWRTARGRARKRDAHDARSERRAAHLRRAVEAGCGVGVMESSSQALDLHRCDALRYAVAVFTNLTRDHLDYHGTMESYFASKRKLFDGSIGERPALSVINVDDGYGERLAAELEREGQRVVRLGLEKGAEVTAREVEYAAGGMRLRLVTPQGERVIETPLVGRPHVYNILSAAACGPAFGFTPDAVGEALRTAGGAPGRFERVRHAAGDFAVVVDYAHTDDALLNVLQDGARGGGGSRHHGLRLRRRPRPHEARADGRSGRAAERHRHRHFRQPAHGRPGGDSRRRGSRPEVRGQALP